MAYIKKEKKLVFETDEDYQIHLLKRKFEKEQRFLKKLKKVAK